jgi:membrane associated rhomboid family serine protease
MVKSRENLNSIYILLFLSVVFYLLQTQDVRRYVELFSFDRDAVMAGQAWRLFTYQFVQSGALSLFFELLILYIMGSVLEQLWGTWDFLGFYAASLLGSAAVGWAFDFQLLGSYFLLYSLLFVYAYLFPEQTFLIFFVLPVKVKWIAWFSGAMLLFGVLRRDPSNVAALGGVIASVAYFIFSQRPGRILPRRVPAAFRPAEETAPSPGEHGIAERNLETFGEVRRVLEAGDEAERRALIASIEKNVTPGVNICPPADYKPEHEDRYCVRCEGFAECTIRFINLSPESSEPSERDASDETERSRSSAV